MVNNVSPDWDKLWDDYYYEAAHAEVIEDPKRGFSILKGLKKRQSDALHNIVQNKTQSDINRTNTRYKSDIRRFKKEGRDIGNLKKPRKVNISKQSVVRHYDKFYDKATKTVIETVRNDLIPKQKRFFYTHRTYEKYTDESNKIRRRVVKKTTRYYKSSDIDIISEGKLIGRLINKKNKRFVPIPKKWRI